MICPVELADEVSALERPGKGFMPVCGDEAEHRGRVGAGDENTRSNVAGDGQANNVVAGSRDHRDQLPADAAVGAAGWGGPVRGGWRAAGRGGQRKRGWGWRKGRRGCGRDWRAN